MKPRHARRRGIYLLPNLITTASLFVGFFGVVRALNGDFSAAAFAVFICALLDGLDGRIARMTDTVTRFGAEYDSLTDAVVFGLVPALTVYLWAFSALEPGQILHRVGWLAAFFYAASTLLRLARFNAHSAGEKYFFRGLPSPAAAVLIMSLVWSWQDLGYASAWITWVALTAVITVSAAMVSNLSYHSLKGLHFKNRVPFITMLAVVVGFVIAAVDLPRFLLFSSLVYLLSAPTLYLFRRWRKPAPSAVGADRPDDG